MVTGRGLDARPAVAGSCHARGVHRFVCPPTPLSAHDEAVVRAIALPLTQAVLHELALRGPVLRGELVAATGASPMAVSRHLAELEGLGLVVASVPAGQRAGRRVEYAADPAAVASAVELLRGYLLGLGA
jgi:DNA-binding transcriptional ArsR family regulator